ncbi:hypothetical protein BH11ACT8_BH11ACT8_32850 [soil metagenome]
MCLTVVPVPPKTRLRRLLPVLLVGAALTVLGPVGAPPASASSTYHCSGYQPCADLGMGSSGYAAHSNKMYWRMYSGHNCTNYVAYRMIQAGMSTERPWTGSGNASNWGAAMSSITDHTPRVGAVAWWKAGVTGAGSSGHVAYVEKVVSSTEIVISEDSYNGTFHWRTLVNDGPGWPSGFIHFVDKEITATAPPRVLGAPRVGETLTARTGVWKPSGPTKQVEWLADGVPVPGATATTFTLGAKQAGAVMSVRVTAAKKGYSTAVVDSAATAAVALGALTNGGPPDVSGSPEVDQVLTATPGVWSPAPDITALRWKANGIVIKGVSGPTLTLTRNMVGKTITVAEVARRDGYAKGAVDSPSAVGPVVEGVIEVTEPFAAAGRNRYGDQLSIAPGTITPRDASITYTWLRDGTKVAAGGATTYQLGRDDIGHDIAVRVTATKPRYRSLVRNFRFATTTTPSATAFRATSNKKKMVIVGVKVHAGGLGPVDGPVTVTVGKNRGTGTAVDGFVRIAVRNLSPGWRRVVVTYGGAGAVESSRAATKVKVKR